MFDLIRRNDAVLIAFDLIELDGKDLRRSPIEHRKCKLAKLARGLVVSREPIADHAPLVAN